MCVNEEPHNAQMSKKLQAHGLLIQRTRAPLTSTLVFPFDSPLLSHSVHSAPHLDHICCTTRLSGATHSHPLITAVPNTKNPPQDHKKDQVPYDDPGNGIVAQAAI
jgi:hypothetical protein